MVVMPADAQRLYLQTPPYQSYVVAAKIATELPDALFWDDSDPHYYVRRATVDGRTILAGGRDHRTGYGDETQALAEFKPAGKQKLKCKSSSSATRT